VKTLLAFALAFGFSAAAHAHDACTNGEQHYWPSNNPALLTGETSAQDVLWTCVNGRFVEEYTAPALQYRGCAEGDVKRFPVSDSRLGSEAGSADEPFVCRNGKYVEMYPERRK
jgi:hypothetical protein